jgi:hypothetical protein
LPQTSQDEWEDLGATPKKVAATGASPKPATAGDWEAISTPVAQGQVEEEKPPVRPSALSRFGSGVWSSVKNALPQSLEDYGRSIYGTINPAMAIPGMVGSAVDRYKQARGEGQPVVSSVASGASSAIGVDPEEVRSRASEGDIAGIVGMGVPAIATTLAGGRAGDIADAASGLAAKTLRNEAGALRPAVKGLARMGGGMVGSLAGPGGSVAGALSGPSIAESLVPPRQLPSLGTGAPLPFTPSLEENLSRAVKEGRAMKIPGRMPKTSAATARPATVGGVPVPDVNVIPEPRAAVSTDRPGAQWSVNRKTGLVPAAYAGKPGAGDVLSNLSTVLYTPRGAGIGEGPRLAPPDLGVEPSTIEAPVQRGVVSTVAPHVAPPEHVSLPATLATETGARIAPPRGTTRGSTFESIAGAEPLRETSPGLRKILRSQIDEFSGNKVDFYSPEQGYGSGPGKGRYKAP